MYFCFALFIYLQISSHFLQAMLTCSNSGLLIPSCTSIDPSTTQHCLERGWKDVLQRKIWVSETCCIFCYKTGFSCQNIFDWLFLPRIVFCRTSTNSCLCFMIMGFQTAHYVKSVQIRRFFWSVFSCIWTEYWDLRSKSVQTQENTDQKNPRIRTLFTQCALKKTTHITCKGFQLFTYELKEQKKQLAYWVRSLFINDRPKRDKRVVKSMTKYSSKICGRQPLKNLKGNGLLKQTISVRTF